jgi:hypothetical protein
MATEPYVPNPPPQGGTLEETQRYLEDEFNRVSLAIRSTSVQAAYGGISIVPPAVEGNIGLVPSLIAPWDATYPPRPDNRTVLLPIDGSITTLESGAYQMGAQVNVLIDTGDIYTMTLYRNGIPTAVTATWDTSNQTNEIWMQINVLVGSDAGDVYTLWANSDSEVSLFTITHASFQMFRVSELLR